MAIDTDEVEQDINSQIARLTSYGVRKEFVPSRGYYCLTWSNGARKWFVGREETPGRYISLDANELLVRTPRRLLKRLVDEDRLDPLPLYKGSFGSRSRGEFSLEDIEIPPPMEGLRDTGGKLDKQN